MTGGYSFDGYHLDPANRRLSRGGEPVEVSSRYLDALLLLVADAGRLVSKDRFMAEVWRGVPVTDEALTQCIRALRRALGDDAGRPRFIETVPKHGYRFVAPVGREDASPPTPNLPTDSRPVVAVGGRPAWLRVARGGTVGGALAGLVGGLLYGFAAASGAGAGTGAASMLILLALITTAIAALGAAAVTFGIVAAESRMRGEAELAGILGGAIGGLLVGAVVKLLGTDAFALLLGQSPGDFTGAGEGLVLGLAVGLGSWSAQRLGDARRAVPLSAALGGLTGGLIALAGGTLLGGSLVQLASGFPRSRLKLDAIGALVGEAGFGPRSLVATSVLEGALFCGCVVGGTVMARRALRPRA